MHYRKFGNKYYVRMDRGEEIISNLKALCESEEIRLGEVKALGAVNDFTVGLFNTQEKKYHSNNFKFDAEIVSFWGTVTTMNGEVYLHIHMSAGDGEGHVYGGHLNRAVVSATCEMIVEVSEGTVERKYSEEIGLNLFEFID